MSHPAPKWKQPLRGVLQLLGSEERQLAYEREVPHVDITAELVCLWFDDSYHADDAAFRASFSADELAALAEFNALFDEQRLHLPESEGTTRTWLASPVWHDIMRMAEQTLQREWRPSDAAGKRKLP